MGKMKKAKEEMLALLDAIGDGIELLTLTRRYQKIFMFEGLEGVRRIRDAKERQRLRERLTYLKRQKLIKESRRGERIIFELTDDGKRRLLRAQLRNAPMRTDGLLTIVIFDIPESERVARELFRRFLKEVGFKRIQHSVWATNQDVRKPFAEFIQEHRAAAWVNIIEGHLIVPGSKKHRSD